MQCTTVRSKEKDYDIYLKTEKLVHSQQEHEKNVSQLFGSGKKRFLAISSLKHCCSYLERRKKWILFGDQIMQCTTVRSKEKDYDIYLKQKNWFTASRSTKKMFPTIWKWFLQLFRERKKWIPAIWRPKNVVHNCQEKGKNYDIYLQSVKLVHIQQEHEKNVSQLFGSGKKRLLAFSSLTNTVAAIWREKKVDPCYLETKKCSSQLLGARKKIMTSI